MDHLESMPIVLAVAEERQFLKGKPPDLGPVSPFREKIANRLDSRIRLLLHNPMAGICDYSAFNIGGNLVHDCGLLFSK